MNKWPSLRRCMLVATIFATFVSQETWALAGTTGGISGYVRDTDGNPVVNARVTMSSPSEVTSTSTDASGHFALLSLAPDTYLLGAIKDGYQESSLAGVTVFADQVQTVAVTMRKLLRTIRDIGELIAHNILRQHGSARATHYELLENARTHERGNRFGGIAALFAQR